MSLVVLRSWSDGQPPKVRAIAPPDSDKDEVVVPDNKGHFVTTEVGKVKNVITTGAVEDSQRVRPIPQPRSSVPTSLKSVSSSTASCSPSPPVPELRTKSRPWSTSFDNTSDKARTLPHDFRKLELLPLSRESSINSGGTDSPPSSPVCGSRYKCLGPELAATIPRRQIIRETWVKESHSNFKKQKELSKSTPDLLSRDDLVKQGPPNPPLRPPSIRNQPGKPRPLSYIDIFYGSDGEPQFGDRPASVVEVFKKDPLSNEFLSQSERNLNKTESRNAGIPKVSKKYKAGRSLSSEIRREPISVHQVVTVRKDSLPSLPSFQASSQVFRSELQLPHLSSTELQFPVHKVIHKDSSPFEALEAQVKSQKADFSNLNSAIADKNVLNQITPQNDKKEGEIRSDEDNDVDLELEGLRGGSSHSTASTVEVEPVLANSPDGIICVQSESDMSTTCSSSSTSSPQFFFKDTRRSNTSNLINSKEPKINGSAWAQVPVQCINRHVFLPQEPFSIPLERMKNGQVGQPQPTNYGINQQRRKNFCDELLNDVIIRVPQSIRPKLPPTNSPPPPQLPNHDGIIIFDEEEEDELNLADSENESIVISEREKSVDYISIFHNVQVGSISDYSKHVHKYSMPEVTRNVGLDLGSLTTRYATLEKSTGNLVLGPIRRTIITADGLSHGSEAIRHAMLTKSKLIYKWKRKQSFPYDPYDTEDSGTTLETLLHQYRTLLGPKKHSKQNEESVHSSVCTQWNLSIHGGMDKKLVRETALNSGFVKSDDELRLVNESTAAAVTAYRFLQRQIPAHTWGKTFLSVNIGSTFIHTSGYELQGSKLHCIESSDSQLYESLETNFIELFSRLFGREFILKYESAFQPSWIEILVRFDEMKDQFCQNNSDCYLFLPISFYLEYNKFTGMLIPECLEDNNEEGVRWDRNGAIQFKKALMTDWLQPIVNFVNTRLKIKSYDSIVLSGGGANEHISNELTGLLPYVNIYQLPDAETAVVEGLVRMDSAHMTLSSPFSVGVGVMTPFDEANHPPEKSVTRQGKQWCSDVWDTLIRKGQQLSIGQIVLKRSYVGAQPGQNVLVLPLFKSELEDPKLVTSPLVEKCCELRFEISKDKAWREVQLVIQCYESELSIVATGNDGEMNKAVIDF